MLISAQLITSRPVARVAVGTVDVEFRPVVSAPTRIVTRVTTSAQRRANTSAPLRLATRVTASAQRNQHTAARTGLSLTMETSNAYRQAWIVMGIRENTKLTVNPHRRWHISPSLRINPLLTVTADEIRPSFYRDFTTTPELNPTGAIGGPLTFTRNSAATWDGTSYGADVPRIKTGKGMLLEGARRNDVSYALDYGQWSQTGGSRLAGQADPYGGNKAWLLSRIANVNTYWAPAASTTSQATTYTGWSIVRLGPNPNSRYFCMRIITGYPSRIDVVYDLVNGVVTGQQAQTGWSALTATMTALGDGWFLCVATSTYSGSTNISMLIGSQGAHTAPSIPGWEAGQTEYSDIIVHRSQLEVGSFPSTGIDNNGSYLTRSADLCTLSGDAFTTTGLTQAEGTIFIDADIKLGQNSGVGIMSLGNTWAGGINIVAESPNSYSKSIYVSGTRIRTLELTSSRACVAVSWDAASIRTAINGVVADHAVTVPAFAALLKLGARSDGAVIAFGKYTRPATYAGTLTDAQLAALTTIT